MRATNISKSYGTSRVLDGVAFDLRPGEVHVLAGENGAGKSTLVKIVSGVVAADAGDVQVSGRVAVVHQELSLINSMSVEDNLFLGREHGIGPGRWLLDRSSQRARVRNVLALLDIDCDLAAPVERLPMSVKNRIEIAKALLQESKILFLDEPTSALTKPECERFFEVVARLKAQGCGIVYISHKMDEIYRLADRITVLRDGRLIGTQTAAALPERELVRWMVGRELGEQFPTRPAPQGTPERLRVERLSVRDGVSDDAAGLLVDDVSFSAGAGEIIGFSGLQGAGCTELFQAIFGASSAVGARASGSLAIDGRPTRLDSPAQAWAAGLAYLTNDRKETGLVLGMSIAENIALPSLERLSPLGLRAPSREAELAREHAKNLAIRARSVEQAVESLSGGNQQKVVLAKCLETKPRVLLLDEPTRGVDVGAKHEIYELIYKLTASGVTVLLISTEMPELLALSDRIVVMHRGRVSSVFGKADATQERILVAAMAGKDAAA